jgi:acyl carrier protein
MTQERNGIIQNVRAIISQALKIDEAKVALSSSLIKDLGAESIDFLDIVFRLEKTFKIKIPKGELFPEKILTDARFVKNGLVTPAGLDELRAKMPGVDWGPFAQSPQVAKLGEVFTVGLIVDYISGKLATVHK